MLTPIIYDGKDNMKTNEASTKKDKTTDDEVENYNSSSVVSKQKKHTQKPDPTRYGDWERNGRCIDF